MAGIRYNEKAAWTTFLKSGLYSFILCPVAVKFQGNYGSGKGKLNATAGCAFGLTDT